jgi:hypothetical protein
MVMGSFDYTCCVSGLPIGAGDPVRYILLQASPFSERGDYANGAEEWYIRTPPIRAEYNDYGSIEDCKDPSIQRLWLDAFKLDLVEKGLGDNTVHDVPARKGMAFDELLDATQECHIEVRDLERKRPKFSFMPKSVIPKGIPTLRRVENIIRTAGLTITMADATLLKKHEDLREARNRKRQGNGLHTKDRTEEEEAADFAEDEAADAAMESDTGVVPLKLGNVQYGFIVDQIRHGEIRVRCGGYMRGEETKKMLQVLAKKLRRRYAVMLACGTDRAMVDGELNIRPKMGTKTQQGHDFSLMSESKRPKTFPILQAMIREDVWQALTGTKVETYGPGYKRVMSDVEAYHNAAREAWDFCKKAQAEADESNARRQAEIAELEAKGDEADKSKLEGMRESAAYWLTSRIFMEDALECKFNPISYMISKNPSISCAGLNTHWQLMLKQTLTEEEVTDYLNSMGELALIQSVLSEVRYIWHPSSYKGPQCGEWEAHRKFLGKLYKLTMGPVKERRERDKVDRAESREWDRKEKEKEAKKLGKKKPKKPKKPAEG